MNMENKIIGYCSDCTGVDFIGCNDGEPFDLGESNDFEYAKEVALHHSESCSPYYAEIIDIKTKKTIWETKN